jgi:hypothetical protein
LGSKIAEMRFAIASIPGVTTAITVCILFFNSLSSLYPSPKRNAGAVWIGHCLWIRS